MSVDLRDKLDALTIQLGNANEELKLARAEIRRLRATIDTDTANARAAGWESAHVTAIEWHQHQRSVGPHE